MSAWNGFVKSIQKAAKRSGVTAFCVSGLTEAGESKVSSVALDGNLMSEARCLEAFEKFVQAISDGSEESEK